MSARRAAIIGAGACGLPAIKTCLEYGLAPVCFEKTNDIGGLWRYKLNECDGEASVMKSTVINTSKEMMAFTDFPPPSEFPNFMHNRKVLEYFRMYADNFKLLSYIRFQTIVENVSKDETEGNDEFGDWILEIKDMVSGVISTQRFHAVFVCTGHHVDPYIPSLPGVSEFKGRVFHSHSYKDHVGFEDKRVIVVGIGNSGGDIATELSRIAAQVYLVTRRGTWVFNRIADRGYPIDVIVGSHFVSMVRRAFPSFSAWFAERRLNARFDHAVYGLKPKHGVTQAHPTVNDDLPNRIACGTIIVKPDVRKFIADGAEFEDGSVVNDIDVVILATGYSFSFPCVSETVIRIHENNVDLYKMMIPPDFAQPGLFVIGLFQPLGAIMPMAEMQCRVACELMTGRISLPSKEVMLRDIKKKREEMSARYVASRRHTIQVDYVPYMFELGSLIGSKVNWTNFLLSDFKLSMALLFGPMLPYQLRLRGYHPWPLARETILTVKDRILAPTIPRKSLTINAKTDKRSWSHLSDFKALWFCFIFILVVSLMFAF